MPINLFDPTTWLSGFADEVTDSLISDRDQQMIRYFAYAAGALVLVLLVAKILVTGRGK